MIFWEGFREAQIIFKNYISHRAHPPVHIGPVSAGPLCHVNDKPNQEPVPYISPDITAGVQSWQQNCRVNIKYKCPQ